MEFGSRCIRHVAASFCDQTASSRRDALAIRAAVLEGAAVVVHSPVVLEPGPNGCSGPVAGCVAVAG